MQSVCSRNARLIKTARDATRAQSAVVESRCSAHLNYSRRYTPRRGDKLHSSSGPIGPCNYATSHNSGQHLSLGSIVRVWCGFRLIRAETRVSPRANDRALAWDARCSFSAWKYPAEFFPRARGHVGVVPTFPAMLPAVLLAGGSSRRILRFLAAPRISSPFAFLHSCISNLHLCCIRAKKCSEERTKKCLDLSGVHKLPHICHVAIHTLCFIDSAFAIRD